VDQEIHKDFGFQPAFGVAKALLEENDGAGNTFKATAKPVLIGTAVTGATTMIFSIIVLLTHGLQPELVNNLSLLHAPFLLGLVTGGAMIYWFTGASTQAVTTGAHRAVAVHQEQHQAGGRDEGVRPRQQEGRRDLHQYAQRGMFNIFLAVFFGTLAFGFFEPYYFVGYLISIALFGLYQAIFMANAGAAWDNAKKIVETDLKEKGTPLHAATVVGDTVGDPFKDTSSVAMNPVIKFTTLFGLLASNSPCRWPPSAGRGSGACWARCFWSPRWSSCGGRSTPCASKLRTDQPQPMCRGRRKPARIARQRDHLCAPDQRLFRRAPQFVAPHCGARSAGRRPYTSVDRAIRAACQRPLPSGHAGSGAPHRRPSLRGQVATPLWLPPLCGARRGRGVRRITGRGQDTRFWIFAERRQRVQTKDRWVRPLSSVTRTRWRFGLKRRFVMLWAWLTLFPNCGFLRRRCKLGHRGPPGCAAARRGRRLILKSRGILRPESRSVK